RGAQRGLHVGHDHIDDPIGLYAGGADDGAAGLKPLRRRSPVTVRGRRPNALMMLVFAVVSCAVTASNPVWLDISIMTGVLSLILLSAGLSFSNDRVTF